MDLDFVLVHKDANKELGQYPAILTSRFVICIYVYIIDQARGQDGWMLAEFSFCVLMDRDEVEVHKNAKRERGQYPAISTELAWSIKDLLYGIKSTEKMIFVLVIFEH